MQACSICIDSKIGCMRSLLRVAGADGLTAAQLAARMAAQAPPSAGAGAGTASAGAVAPADTEHAGLGAAQGGTQAAGLEQEPPSQNPNTNPACAAALLRVLCAAGLARHAPAFSGWATVAAEHAGCYLVEPPALALHPGTAPADAPAAAAAQPPALGIAQAPHSNPADGSNLSAAHAAAPTPPQPPASALADGTPATATPAAASADAPEALEALAAGAGPAIGTVLAKSVRAPRLVPWDGGAAHAGPNPDPVAKAGEGLGVRTLAAVAPVVPAPPAAAQTAAQSHEAGADAEQAGGARAAAAPSQNPKHNPGQGGAALLVPWRDHRGRLIEGMWRSLVHRALSVVVRHPGAPVERPFFTLYMSLWQSVTFAESSAASESSTSHVQGDGNKLL